jgi:hypothetical protein
MMTMTLNEADYQKHKVYTYVYIYVSIYMYICICNHIYINMNTQEVEYHTLTERMNIAALWWPMAQVHMCTYL